MKDQSIKKFSELGIKVEGKRFVGEKIRIAKILGKEIIVHFHEIKDSKYPEKGSDKCLYIQISLENTKYVAFSIAKLLMKTLDNIPEDSFPFRTTIVNNNDQYEFT